MTAVALSNEFPQLELRSFVASFAVNTVLTANPSIGVLGGALATMASVIGRVVAPILRNLFPVHNFAAGLVKIVTVFAVCSMASQMIFGIPFNVISTIVYSSFAMYLGLDSYIYIV